MKTVLAVLLCYLLFDAECCFVHKGGPFEGGKGVIPSTGTYAGVLMPDPVVSPFTNSIGLFSVVFPTTGLGTGTLVIFQTGQTYTGSVQGLIDPKGGKISALLYASFPYVRTIQTGTDDAGNPIFTTETVISVASGQMNAKVTATSRVTGTAD